jgi:phosphatidylinositol glycan class V
MSVSSSPLTKALDHPTRSLTIVFILWKTFLLLVASCSPGPGYDTSTSLAQHTEGERIVRNALTSSLSHISQKLTRWDAIYFTSIARRGYIYEQEWAFGWGFTHIISFFTVGKSGCPDWSSEADWPCQDLKGAAFDYEFLESIVGISIAHVAHGLSVLAIYCLTRAIFPGAQSKKLAFVTACLYILSPAGLFLSAPYGESTYALLSFTGYLLFVRGYGVDGQLTTLHDLSTMVAGMLLAAATTIRSNGILHGIVFLESAFRLAWSLKDGLKWRVVRRLAAVVFGGLCIGMGFVLPQWIAYNEFCAPVLAMEDGQPRVWCQRTLPSVYTFVQDYYW